MRSGVRSALSAILLAFSTALAFGAAYYVPTASTSAMVAYGTLSPSIAHAYVAGTGSYDWVAGSCTPSAPNSYAATGVSSSVGCWVNVGFVTGGSSSVNSVVNSDGTLTISPTTGAVIASLNLSHLNNWGSAQSEVSCALADVAGVFTPDFHACQNITLLLDGNCPCTLANPTNAPPASGFSLQGGLDFLQDGTGGRTIGTYGSDYYTGGGTATIALSSAPNALDVGSYKSRDATHIIIGIGEANVTH